MSSANYKNLYALISTLSDGVKKMEKGNLNPLQVELLLDDARSLHERLAVIQYLSFEKQVKAEEDVDNETEKEKKKPFGIKFDNVEKQEILTKQIDLEESIDEVLETNIKEKATIIMKSRPIVANENLLISSAIVLMNKHSITSLIVAKQNKPIGIVNIKKCLEND